MTAAWRQPVLHIRAVLDADALPWTAVAMLLVCSAIREWCLAMHDVRANVLEVVSRCATCLGMPLSRNCKQP